MYWLAYIPVLNEFTVEGVGVNEGACIILAV